MAKRRHHYIPQFYLKKFGDPKANGRIWCYPKTSGVPFCARPADLGGEKDYHTFTKSDGSKDTDTIEDDFSIIEGTAATAITKVLSGTKLSTAEHESFVAFCATMLLRVPRRRDQIGKIMEELASHMMQAQAWNKESFHTDYRKYQSETGDTSNVDPEELRQFILSEKHELKANPTIALGMSLGAMETVMDCLLKMNWAFIHREGRFSFITCDNPVFYCDPTIPPNTWYGVGLMSTNIELSFPLSPEVIAFAGHRPLWKQRTAQPEIVRLFNQRTLEAAHRYIFAAENSQALERVITQNDPSKPIRTR
jgi:hypothetical protein